MLAAMTTEPHLLRTQGTALHRQIFLVLRDGIVQGTYPPGSALPKEEALVKLFGVARATVRRALADLEADGLVQRRHGSGTFVLEGLSTGANTTTLGFIDELRHTGQSTEVRVIVLESVPPPPKVRAFLQTPQDEMAVHAVRVRVAGGIPLMITEAWVPTDVGRGISAAALRKKPMYKVLNGLGVSFGRVVQEISAESADPYKAALLDCELSTALIRMTRLMHDRSGRPIEHLTAHMTPQHSRILMEIPGDAIDTLSAGHILHDPALVGSVTARTKRMV
jgi:GntR family transcriptional regulator